MNIDAIAEAAIEAANDALTDLTVYNVDYGVIEEAVEEAIQEAIEKDRQERKPEAPFTFGELMDLRQGIHQLRLRNVEERAAQFAVAIEFGIDFDSEKWKEFKMKRDTQLEALYDKVSELINNLNAK